MKTDAYIETRSGKKITFLDPNPDDIDIRDIAYALANQCRFNGHCSGFYSVAEHSVLVSSRLPTQLQLAGLLHDAAEAYIGDIPSPVKQFLPDFHKIEYTLELAIFDKFGVTKLFDDSGKEIKRADLDQLYTEAHYLLPSKGQGWGMWNGPVQYTVDEQRAPGCLMPAQAYRLFMDIYHHLTQSLVIAA